jgi:formylglycine-generating enzyme required for sulfatase activity
MMLVPPGCFNMGSTDGEPSEQPVTKICFDKPFLIDKLEVTQGQFARLGGLKEEESENVGVDRPVEVITWDEARDFCEQRRGARLPTEAEWEYAARGPDDLIYPWGNEWNKNNAVWNHYDDAGNTLGTADVGSIPAGASWVGALDMIGNVQEWTSSLMMPYPYNPDDGRENPDENSSYYRVARGQSFVGISVTQARAAWRGQGGGKGFSNREYGMRCARS